MKRFTEWTLTRREALAAMGVMVAATQFRTAAAESAKPKIALQLYTMREPAKKNLDETLKKCRDIGWEYVQWSGMPDMPAEKIREALDKAGMKAIACHTGVDGFEKNFDEQVKFWKTVGVQYVGPGGMMDDCKENLEAWLRGAKRFDVLGEKLQAAGMGLTYHNHAGEFEKYEGDARCKLDILFESTSPKNLFAELDLAWVQVGEQDPAAYIKKYKGRCPTVHAKDLAPDTKKNKVHFAPLGKGILKWDEIFSAGKDAGIQWYIYEQDSCDGSPFDAAKTSFDFLSKSLA